MGPITLFDKSFLQSLSMDESVWFDHYFYSNICPLFYVETLADLSKTSLPTGRTPEREVSIIAGKTPETSGGPCRHHHDLCVAELKGHRVPMRGQIPVAGARPVRSSSGQNGVVYDATPEAQAFTRWQRGEFKEVERLFAHGWRKMLTNLDLPATATRMRLLGIDPKSCKSLDQAHEVATSLVRSKTGPFEQMALLFAFVGIPPELQRPILQRWGIEQNRPLAEYAPYTAHVLAVELFFQIALGANLISADRASNRVDIGYLFYLPFCMIFTSSDKLHQKCAPFFLRPDQDFVWGLDLKTELSRLNTHFLLQPESEKELGVMHLGREPVGDDESLMIRLWDRHAPGWRRKKERTEPIDPQAQKELVASLRELTDSPTVHPSQVDFNLADPDRLAIQRFVRKRKGSWWQLPKDLKVDENDDRSPSRGP